MKHQEISSMDIKKQLDLAIESRDKEIHYKLLFSKVMNVRRALAKNSSISEEIANTLSRDPVMNVSYIASKNPKCTTPRTYKESKLSDCVLCTHDERLIECTVCEQKKRASFLNY